MRQWVSLREGEKGVERGKQEQKDCNDGIIQEVTGVLPLMIDFPKKTPSLILLRPEINRIPIWHVKEIRKKKEVSWHNNNNNRDNHIW